MDIIGFLSCAPGTTAEMKSAGRRGRFRPNEVKKGTHSKGCVQNFPWKHGKMCQERLSECIRRYPQRAHDGGGTPRPRAHHGRDIAPECAAGAWVDEAYFVSIMRQRTDENMVSSISSVISRSSALYSNMTTQSSVSVQTKRYSILKICHSPL